MTQDVAPGIGAQNVCHTHHYESDDTEWSLCGFATQYRRRCYTLPFFVACCVVMRDNRQAN